MFDHVNLVDILSVSMIAFQVVMSFVFLIISQEVRKEQADTGRKITLIEDSLRIMFHRFEEIHLLDRLLVRWIDVQREDTENMKGVIDEICLHTRVELVKNISRNSNDDAHRQQQLQLCYKRLALYSDDPEHILSATRFLSQWGGASELMLTLRLFAGVETGGEVKLREKAGWTENQRAALLVCIHEWCRQLQISGQDLRYFFTMSDLA